MQFLDCNLSYGPQKHIRSCATLAELKAHMSRAGIMGGLVIQSLSEVKIANETLSKDLQGETLKGVWRLLPSSTKEIPLPHALPNAMREGNIAALTICPSTNRFMPNKFAIGDYMEMASERKIPVMFNTSRGLTLEQAATIMSDFPNLTCILTYANCWPSDRQLRPFLDAFPNLYLDIAYMLTDSGLKELPAKRMLFGSAFPESYMGAQMMVIKHAEIPEEDKCLIAGENLKRLLNEACYD